MRTELFNKINLLPTFFVLKGDLPPELTPSSEQFEALWELHPANFHELKMHGKLVKTPRWQQAYGQDYKFTGVVNKALALPQSLLPLHEWCKSNIDSRLNGILVNWYDGKLGHYIGPHRDSRANMVEGSPIVTVSLGEERVFRLRPWPKSSNSDVLDIAVPNGAIVVMPWEANLNYTHEIVRSKKKFGRRVSITFRCFE